MRNPPRAAHLRYMDFNDRAAAHRFLAALSVGDRLTVVAGSKSNKVTVQRTLRPMDGGRNGRAFGSWDHSAVTVGFGPGRWNIEVTPAALVDGRVIIEHVHEMENAA